MDLRRNETYFVPMAVHKNNDFQGTSRAAYHRNNIKPVYNNNCDDEQNFLPFQSFNTNVVNNLNSSSRKFNNLNNLQRPNVLNICSYANVKHNQLNKNVNLSLPHSPVCEEEFSSIGCKSEKSKKRYSCSFYIDFNENPSVDNSVAKETVVRDDDRDYSSDSLDDEKEEYASPKMRRRRCISEYQLSWRECSRDYQKNAEEEAMRSYWNSSLTDINRSHSEENILNDDADSLQDNSDRHSSASFFLRKRKAFNSSESILTDESEYQFLFSNKEVFRSTESILTDASDSNLNSVSDDMNLTEETTWSQVTKKPVLRTRSLQDTQPSASGGELTRYFVTQKEMNQNRSCEVLDRLEARYESKKPESFFIPVDNNVTARTPDDVKQIIMKKISSRRKPESKNDGDLKALDHPVVTHKPPKPQNKPATLSGSKTYRKKLIPSTKDESKLKRSTKNPKYQVRKTQMNILENIEDKDKMPEKFSTDTFTKSRSNLGKNLLRNPIAAKSCNTAKLSNVNESPPKESSDYGVLDKNTKNEMLKRGITITKYDTDLINANLSKKFQTDDACKSFQNYLNNSKFKRHSLPVAFVSLSQLSDCFPSSSNDGNAGNGFENVACTFAANFSLLVRA